jgi:hypothetical protein
MLASTVQFSKYGQHPPGNPRAPDQFPKEKPKPYEADKRQTTRNNKPTNTRLACSLRTQQCAYEPSRTTNHLPPNPKTGVLTADTRDNNELVSVPPSSNPHETFARAKACWTTPHTGRRLVLLRKEVIQPHLPVRLPCYDFVPIADPTFDGSLPQGVGPPASGVTDFRDVTGGVYKARERIHRSVADLRLLATPTSWGRVADPNPN